MLLAAILVFSLTILGGLTTGVGHREHYRPPKWLALAHGTGGATGILLLVITYISRPQLMGTLGAWSLGLFILAALVGLFLFSQRYTSRSTPRGVILLHATIAFSAYLLLIATKMQHV